jgi:hypothetical protein
MQHQRNCFENWISIECWCITRRMEAAQHRLVSRWLSNEARAVCEAGALSDGCGCTGAELSKALLEAFAGLPSQQSAAVLARAFTAAGVSENSSLATCAVDHCFGCLRLPIRPPAFDMAPSCGHTWHVGGGPTALACAQVAQRNLERAHHYYFV